MLHCILADLPALNYNTHGGCYSYLLALLVLLLVCCIAGLLIYQHSSVTAMAAAIESQYGKFARDADSQTGSFIAAGSNFQVGGHHPSHSNVCVLLLLFNVMCNNSPWAATRAPQQLSGTVCIC